ncbi:GNAT family N-acetyltransferase [Rivularia sp. UHCC 0363]|uniref:GNAT family N-acetyltransferase n=1 Tax=Rivularia sp. UHCC 0363 TaxID=3110244 RepID=UPI002B2182EC|nr:GNAT family N-acetyltransferase [Rivularia sp. UHCC 0363]MEA5594203.1 GNAT family N-acetyltransferase [Rivularia sp. UHCC 0363]
MNEFRYIVGATREVRQGLVLWARKAREYVNTYYEGREENARGTDFYRGILKTRQIVDSLLNKEDSFRGVIDDQGLLASVCIIQETSILFEDTYTDCLEIESLTNSPWNTIEYQQLQRRKGAATSLVEGIIKESQESELSNIFKLMTIPGAKRFYQKIGFEETNGSGKMILNPNSASMLLLDLDQKRNSAAFD